MVTLFTFSALSLVHTLHSSLQSEVPGVRLICNIVLRDRRSGLHPLVNRFPATPMSMSSRHLRRFSGKYASVFYLNLPPISGHKKWEAVHAGGYDFSSFRPN